MTSTEWPWRSSNVRTLTPSKAAKPSFDRNSSMVLQPQCKKATAGMASPVCRRSYIGSAPRRFGMRKAGVNMTRFCRVRNTHFFLQSARLSIAPLPNEVWPKRKGFPFASGSLRNRSGKFAGPPVRKRRFRTGEEPTEQTFCQRALTSRPRVRGSGVSECKFAF
jgi:hypothetical protein